MCMYVYACLNVTFSMSEMLWPRARTSPYAELDRLVKPVGDPKSDEDQAELHR